MRHIESFGDLTIRIGRDELLHDSCRRCEGRTDDLCDVGRAEVDGHGICIAVSTTCVSLLWLPRGFGGGDGDRNVAFVTEGVVNPHFPNGAEARMVHPQLQI